MTIQVSSSVMEWRWTQFVRSLSCPTRSQYLWWGGPCGASWRERLLITSSAGLPWTQATKERGSLMAPTLTTLLMMSCLLTSNSSSDSIIDIQEVLFLLLLTMPRLQHIICFVCQILLWWIRSTSRCMRGTGMHWVSWMFCMGKIISKLIYNNYCRLLKFEFETYYRQTGYSM